MNQTPKTPPGQANGDDPMQALARALATADAEQAQAEAKLAAAPKSKDKSKTSDGMRKAATKSARTRAREFAVQALYQHLVGADDVTGIDTFTRDLSGFHKADAAHFDALLHGCVEESADLDALIAPHLDRPLGEISPIERAVMWIGAYEMLHCLDVPWRVVINECVELAKSFGGTDGHKFVNGVLNTIAPKVRPAEVQGDRHRRP
jgi:N utilization substance protein B